MSHLRLSEDSVIRGDRYVAGEGEPRSGTETPAADGADDRFRILPAVELAPENMFPIRVAKVVVSRIERSPFGNAVGPRRWRIVPADVFADRKRPARAGNDDGANLGIGFGLSQCSIWLVHHFFVHGVQRVGPIESDQHSFAL